MGAHAHPETLTPQPPPCSPPDLSNCRCGLPDPLTSPGAVWPAPHLRSLMVGLRWSEGKVLHAPPVAGVMPPTLRAGPSGPLSCQPPGFCQAYPHSPGSGFYSPETSPPLSEGLRPWSQTPGDDHSSATY